MLKIVPMEDMYQKKRGVPPIAGVSVNFREEIQKSINALPLFDCFEEHLPLSDCFEVSSDEPQKLIAELEEKGILIEKSVREEIFCNPSFCATGALRIAVELVEVTAGTLGLEENASYGEILYVAGLYELMPCVERIAPRTALFYAEHGLTPKNPYVVFARHPLANAEQKDPILFTLEVTSRIWGGVTLGAVNGALDFVAPGRKYIFAKKYTRL